MTKEDKDKALAQLAEFAEWAEEGTIYANVCVERDEYYFDAGAFGEISAAVFIEEDDYELSARDAIDNNSPISWRRLGEIVRDLEAEPAVERETLDDVLDRMTLDGDEHDKRLARVLWNVVYAMREERDVTSPASGNELPPEPLPWPGALRDEIDYTAEDFPLRYQPPPGFDWAKSVTEGTRRAPSYKEACAVPVNELGTSHGQMLLDNKGRVRWLKNADDDYTSGSRWLVWAMERAGIPGGNGSFSGSTPPMALDKNGVVINEGLLEANAENFKPSQLEAAQNAIQALREKAQAQGNGSPKFAPPEPVSV